MNVKYSCVGMIVNCWSLVVAFYDMGNITLAMLSMETGMINRDCSGPVLKQRSQLITWS